MRRLPDEAIRTASGAALLALLLALSVAAPAAAAIPVHAHRGGSVVDGKPTYPENTIAAFRAAAREGFVLELDTKLTRDGVPVVIHDATLDRTTDCEGEVAHLALAELRRCRADVLGSPGSDLPTREIRRPTERVPTLARVLRLASRTGSRVNVEIKNLPTDSDFDPGERFARRVVDVLAASPLPRARMIVQSFWPPNLDVAEARLPAADTSLLTLSQLNEGAPAFAALRDYEWVSPAFPVSATYVSEAHAVGRRVVPYTLDAPADVRAAARANVDELISNDPTMARREVRGLAPDRPKIPPPPPRSECRELRAARSLPLVRAFDPEPRAPRVFAMQFKIEIRHFATYEAFRTKIECMVRDYVVPHLARDRPNVVAFNEDIGLPTIATGSRARAARELFGRPGSPSCEPQGVPCGTLAGLYSIAAGYAPQAAAYRARFPDMAQLAFPFVAATDTFVRGWMQVFSDIARRYDVYILGSNNQPLFRESTDPAEIDHFRDPDLPRPASVYVATAPEVYNEAFMWGPEVVDRDAPGPLRNVVARNKKVPITPIETQLELTNGPASGPDGIENVRPYRIPGTKARMSFATSLPAFVYGPREPGLRPCDDIARYYMRCLDELGANVVMQDEANPGRWAARGGAGTWQPLEWMTSTWRAAADRQVSFDYNVTPHMVGNLADLGFDGQTAITQRRLRAPKDERGPRRCTYVGNRRFVPEEDPERFEIGGEDQPVHRYVGPKREFLAILPWVAPDGPRDELRAVGERLRPGSGDPLENDYVEGAIAADLPFPPERQRPACAGVR